MHLKTCMSSHDSPKVHINSYGSINRRMSKTIKPAEHISPFPINLSFVNFFQRKKTRDNCIVVCHSNQANSLDVPHCYWWVDNYEIIIFKKLKAMLLRLGLRSQNPTRENIKLSNHHSKHLTRGLCHETGNGNSITTKQTLCFDNSRIKQNSTQNWSPLLLDKNTAA